MYWGSVVLARESTRWEKVADLWNSCLMVGEAFSFSCGFHFKKNQNKTTAFRNLMFLDKLDWILMYG